MDKLCSMTDFVLDQENKSSYLLKSLNYAKFLKQPLTLGMFVPCDLEGNVLEEPQIQIRQVNYDEWEEDYDPDEVKEYRESKNNVLFEDFFITKQNYNLADLIHLGKKENKTFVHTEDNFCHIDVNDLSKMTIESLVYSNLVLTESAKQKILI